MAVRPLERAAMRATGWPATRPPPAARRREPRRAVAARSTRASITSSKARHAAFRTIQLLPSGRAASASSRVRRRAASITLKERWARPWLPTYVPLASAQVAAGSTTCARAVVGVARASTDDRQGAPVEQAIDGGGRRAAVQVVLQHDDGLSVAAGDCAKGVAEASAAHQCRAPGGWARA